MYNELDIPESGAERFTDFSRWRLLVSDGGRHTWHYLASDEESKEWPQNICDKYWLGLPVNTPTFPKAKEPLEAAKNGYEFYKNLQADDGHWPGEYGGPMFLIPGLVISSYVTGMPFQTPEKLEFIRYLINTANREDGGWGLHIEGHSTVFGTALNYCAIRILGMSASHPVAVKARQALHKLGGAVAAPSWGKFWLSVLNVYDWEGNNPIPPELWLLPEWLPFHPGRWWVHTRAVYIPMGYLWGVRFKAPENSLILSLREELYVENFYKINWPAQRNNVCAADLYAPHSALFEAIMGTIGLIEPCEPMALRKAGLKRCYELLVMDDENTSHQTIAPVGKTMALICRAHAEGRSSDAYRLHEKTRADYMWMGPEGLRVTGTNGSQLWDTVFITQALAETKLIDLPENRDSAIQALKWLDISQMTENPKHLEAAYRHPTKGAWGFSTKEQAYTVSDCTAEGLKSVLYLQHLDFTPKLVSERRCCDSVDLLLSLQNPNGGFASYELVRGPRWLEWLNPAEVFGNIMTEYCYPECTTSVITSLAIFRKQYPHYRSSDIEKTIQKALVYLRSAQQPEGGWVGSWGICFTYATMFALESFGLVNENYGNSKTVQMACHFLLSKQRADGGWGESYKSCEQAAWVEHADSQVVQTCWAVMALMYAGYSDLEPLKKGIKLIMDRQQPDGSWLQEAIEGVFNKTCAISYPNFKFSFPIWTLAKAHDYFSDIESRNLLVDSKTSNGDT